MSELEQEILQLDEKGKNYPNLISPEHEPLHKLRKDNNNVIKPADKVSATDVSDKKDYLPMKR